jgi:hypothetical protein
MSLFKVIFFLEDLVLFLKVFFFWFMGLFFFFRNIRFFFLGLLLLALNMCYFSDQDPRIPHICSWIFLDFSLYVIYP